MTDVFKTQKIPFHIHSGHVGIRGGGTSSLTIPLDPALVLPKKYKATAAVFAFSAVNSIYNVSAELGNNFFYIIDDSQPEWVTLAAEDITWLYSPLTYAETHVGFGSLVTATLTIAKGATRVKAVAAMNTAMGGDCVIDVGIELQGLKHSVYMTVMAGQFQMTTQAGFKWLARSAVVGASAAAPHVMHGIVILDVESGKYPISDPFDAGTISPATNYEWSSPPVVLTLADGIYTAKL